MLSDAPDNAPTVELTGFGFTSKEEFNGGITSMEFGWIEYLSCVEGDNPSTMNPDFTTDELIELAQQAVTVKILPSTDIPGQNETADYAVMADLCSNPIFALNNGYSLSYTLSESFEASLADTDNWIGDNADSLLWNSCSAALYELADGDVYWACGNTGGIPTIFRLDIAIRVCFEMWCCE